MKKREPPFATGSLLRMRADGNWYGTSHKKGTTVIRRDQYMILINCRPHLENSWRFDAIINDDVYDFVCDGEAWKSCWELISE